MKVKDLARCWMPALNKGHAKARSLFCAVKAFFTALDARALRIFVIKAETALVLLLTIVFFGGNFKGGELTKVNTPKSVSGPGIDELFRERTGMKARIAKKTYGENLVAYRSTISRGSLRGAGETSEKSETVDITTFTAEIDSTRTAITLRQGFRSDSPLVPYLHVFEEAAIAYGHDPRLMPAIAVIESSGGLRCAYHNPFGRLKNGTGSGLIRFSSWEAAIWDQAAFIKRHWGSTNDPYKMKGYAADPAWPAKVKRAMNQF